MATCLGMQYMACVHATQHMSHSHDLWWFENHSNANPMVVVDVVAKPQHVTHPPFRTSHTTVIPNNTYASVTVRCFSDTPNHTQCTLDMKFIAHGIGIIMWVLFHLTPQRPHSSRGLNFHKSHAQQCCSAMNLSTEGGGHLNDTLCSSTRDR